MKVSLSLGEIIVKERKHRGITQEELARAVGVSTSAVSKWECGNTYPDITLLSPIARFLGITVDQLLSFEPELSTDEVMCINRKCAEKFETCSLTEAVDFSESFVKQYPNSMLLKLRTGAMFQQYIASAKSEEETMQLVDKAVELIKTVSECYDTDLKHSALYVLSSLYVVKEEFDKAEEALNSIPKSYPDTKSMLASIYCLKGELKNAEKLEQQELFSNVTSAFMHIESLCGLKVKMKEMNEALNLAALARRILEVFDLQDQYAYSNSLMYASIYTALEDKEKTLQWIERFVEDAMRFSKRQAITQIPVFSSLEFMKPIVSQDYLNKNMVRILTDDDKFDFVKDDPRYETILQTLKSIDVEDTTV